MLAPSVLTGRPRVPHRPGWRPAPITEGQDMDLGLKDKVAIVTGSARGLGAATARRLAQEGAKVVINDIVADRAQQTAAALQGEGFAAHCVVADVTKPADAERLVAETVSTFGAVHILVN